MKEEKVAGFGRESLSYSEVATQVSVDPVESSKALAHHQMRAPPVKGHIFAKEDISIKGKMLKSPTLQAGGEMSSSILKGGSGWHVRASATLS